MTLNTKIDINLAAQLFKNQAVEIAADLNEDDHDWTYRYQGRPNGHFVIAVHDSTLR